MSLWNSTPNNPGPKKAGNEPLTANSVKCPSCASNIFYEPEINGMMCRNCGNVYDPTTMEPRGSLGINKEHDYTGDGDMSEDDKKRHEIICNSCGTALVADENTMSTMCPFCGSPALITKRMSREFKPDYIIPFKIDKDRAKSIFNEWLATRQFTPKGFKNKCRLAKMTALYVPFWLLDCCVNTELTGTAKANGIPTEISSKIKYYVKGVPFDASLQIANKLMAALEPFDYSEMVRFENKYLQGFYANKYDQLPTDMTDMMMRRMQRYSVTANQAVANRYSGYEPRTEKDYTYLTDISVKYCLLPVWFITVEYQGNQYQFAVNGQTGEAGGQVPVSGRADLYDRIVSMIITRRLWTIPIYIAIAAAFILFLLTMNLSGSVNGFKTFAVVFFCIVHVTAVVTLLLFLLFRLLRRLFSTRQAMTAYEINDYDKEPDLEFYIDTARGTDLEVKELMLPAAHLLAGTR